MEVLALYMGNDFNQNLIIIGKEMTSKLVADQKFGHVIC